MADPNPYHILRERLAELVATMGLEQVQFTVMVGDGDNEPDHVAVVFRIDADKLIADAETTSEQKAIDDAVKEMELGMRRDDIAAKAEAAREQLIALRDRHRVADGETIADALDRLGLKPE